MIAGSDLTGNDGRPDPTKVATAAEFVDAMRRLKLWTGWGFRRLEKHAAAAGLALPRSTLTVALSRDTLPREELVTTFLRACGCDEDQTAQWVAARRRIAGAADPAPEPTMVKPPAEARPRRRVAWPVRAAAILVVLATAATIGGILLRAGSPAPPGRGVGPGQAAPDQPDRGRSRPGSPATGTTTVPTSTTPPDTGQPPAAATTNPFEQSMLPVPGAPPVPGLPVPNLPTGPTITVPRPTTPTKPTTTTTPTTPTPPNQPPKTETIPLADGRTINCPLPYYQTEYGPLGQCTLRSGDQASIVTYSPAARGCSVSWETLDIYEPTWYLATTLAEDGIYAPTRGYAVMMTHFGAAVWATQYRSGKARTGIFNLVTSRFLPHTGWLPVSDW